MRQIASRANNVSWEFRTPQGRQWPNIAGEKALFDMAKLEAHGLAVIDDKLCQDWRMVIRVLQKGLPGTNQISMVSGEGAGIVNTDDGHGHCCCYWPLSVNYPATVFAHASPEGIEASDQMKLGKRCIAERQ